MRHRSSNARFEPGLTATPSSIILRPPRRGVPAMRTYIYRLTLHAGLIMGVLILSGCPNRYGGAKSCDPEQALTADELNALCLALESRGLNPSAGELGIAIRDARA